MCCSSNYTCFTGRKDSLFVSNCRVVVFFHVVRPLLHFGADGVDGVKDFCRVVESPLRHTEGKLQSLWCSVCNGGRSLKGVNKVILDIVKVFVQ